MTFFVAVPLLDNFVNLTIKYDRLRRAYFVDGMKEINNLFKTLLVKSLAKYTIRKTRR
jgi:hypothetical protein